MVNEALSKEVIGIADSTETHLEKLQKMITGDGKDVDQETITAEQNKLQEQVNNVLNKVTDEHELSDEARTRLHGLVDSIAQAKNTLPEANDKAEENETTAGKVEKIAKKRALPAALVVGVGTAIGKVSEEMGKHKGFFGKTRGLLKGIWKGFIRGGITWLGGKAVELGAGMLNIHPAKRAKDQMNSLFASIKKSTDSLRSRITGTTPEKYDPRNQAVADQRHDSNPEQAGFEGPEVIMNDMGLVEFGRKDGRKELAVLPGDLVLPQVCIPANLDLVYQDPTFTDKYLLTVKTVNMRTQAARKEVQTKGIGSNEGELMGSIMLREQDLLELQELVQNNGSKEEINKKIAYILGKITEFEQHEEYVIGTERASIIVPTITSYTAGTSREKNRQAAQLKIYDGCRHLGGMLTDGDSDVVKAHLMEDMIQKPKYDQLLTLFQDPTVNIFDELSRIPAGTSYDEKLSELIGNHLKAKGFLATSDKKGLSEKVIGMLAKDLITSYHAAHDNIKASETQLKKGFERAYGKDIDSNKTAQQKMITAYESMYPEQLKEFAAKRGANYENDKRAIVRDFAREQSKQQAIRGAVVSSFQDTFFKNYLPTQGVTTGAVRANAPSAKTTYTDPEEALLADIIGADGISDSALNTATDIGVNIAISLIPIMGAEFAASRLLGQFAIESATARIVAGVATRAVVGHVAMSSFSTLTSNHPEHIFENLFDRKEFGNNALFFGVMGALEPIAQALKIGKIVKTATVNAPTLAKLSEHRLTKTTALAGAQTGLIESGRSLFDESYEWSWKEVITIFMMSLALQSKIGEKARDYEAIKTPQGALKLVPSTLALKVANKLEAGSLAPVKSIWSKYEQRLTSMSPGETTIMGSTTVVKTVDKNSIIRYQIKGNPAVYATPAELVGGIKKITKITPQVEAKLREAELMPTIERQIATGATFTQGAEVYKFGQIGQEAQIMRKTAAGWAVLQPAELTTLINNAEQMVVEKVAKKWLPSLTQNRMSMNDVLQKANVDKSSFMDWCKTHELGWVERNTVGDFFKLIGEKRFGKLIFGGLKDGTKRTATYDVAGKLTGYVDVPIAQTFKQKLRTNSHALFNVGSLLYGTAVGDGEDAGLDEGLENYFLYGILGRSLFGKILLATFDMSDVVI